MSDREDRNERIRRAREDGASIADLARQFMIGDRQVWKICQGVEVKVKPRRGRKPKGDRKPLSQMHARVGSRIWSSMSNKDLLDSLKQFSAEVGIPQSVIQDGWAGYHDFTLSQLLVLSEKLGVPIQDLLVLPR